MFTELLETTVAMTDHDLDAAIRNSELTDRQHAARHAALVAVAETILVFAKLP